MNISKIDFKQSILPHIIAIASFLVISLAYFYPQLQNMTLAQHDVKQFRGMAQEIAEYKEETGNYTNWTTSMFGGMPVYQISPHYPNRLYILQNLYDLIVRPIDRPASFMFTYLLGFYIMLLCFKVGPYIAFTGAVAFALSSYNIIIIEAGHNTKAIAMGLAPLVLGCVYATFRTPYWLLFAALAGMFLGFQIRANHVQITYYLMFIILGVGIAELIRAYYKDYLQHFFKGSAALLIAAILGVGAVSTNLLVTWEYGKETIRGPSALEETDGIGGGRGSGLNYDYAMNWSYGIKETGTLLIPNFKGGSSQGGLGTDSETYRVLQQQGQGNLINQIPAYWGDQPLTSGPVYLGAIICFLFITGLFWVKGPMKWALLILSILSIMLAWGKNFPPVTDLFFYYFPLYDRFRAVTMILYIAQVTFPLLGMLGLWKLINNKVSKDDFMKAMKTALGITGGICLLFAIMPGLFTDFTSARDAQLGELRNIVMEDRKSLLQADAMRSLFFILIGAAALWFRHTGKIGNYLAIGIIAGATFVDLWVVDKRYLNKEDFVSQRQFQNIIPKTDADRRVLEDPDPNYRVLNLTVSPFNDATTSYHHKSVGGYHGAKLGRYQDLIDHHLGREIRNLQEVGLENAHMLNMLNTRYIIYGVSANEVLENQHAMGNAWFVNEIRWAENAREAMNILGNINPANTAVVEKEFREMIGDFTPSPSPGDRIELTEFKPDYLKFEASVANQQLAVISEVYYNSELGWNAFINGEKVPHARVNYVLRGIKVPPGEHTIEFKFEPETYYLGERISLISSLLLMFFVLGSIFFHFRPDKLLSKRNS